MPGSGKVLLDTNIVIALLQGEAQVVDRLKQASEVFVPAIVLGELFFGAAKSGRPAENPARIERFAAGNSILPCDAAVAEVYGTLKQRLRVKGRLIPENDLWIAAVAKNYNLVLVTRDGHFRDIDELPTEHWYVVS